MTAFATLLICPCARQSSRKSAGSLPTHTWSDFQACAARYSRRSSGSLSTARALHHRSSARWAWPVRWLARLRGRRRRASGRLKVPVPRFPSVAEGACASRAGIWWRGSPYLSSAMQDLPRTAPERHRAGRDPRVSDAQPRALSVSVHWMLCPVESCGVARARTRARASRAGPGGAAVLTSPKRSRTCSNPKNRGRHQPGRVRATACAVSDAPVHPAAACAPVSRRIYLVTVFPPGPGGNFQHGAETKSPSLGRLALYRWQARCGRCGAALHRAA